jgi:hypothetical protein
LQAITATLYLHALTEPDNYTVNMSGASRLHFIVMMIASIVLFIAILRIILSKSKFAKSAGKIVLLCFVVVVIGMLFGKFGVNWGLPWWVYYTVPLVVTVLLPPYVLKLDVRKTILYLVLSFASAPIIHVVFSFFLGWKEYMPFWNIPYWKTAF